MLNALFSPNPDTIPSTDPSNCSFVFSSPLNLTLGALTIIFLIVIPAYAILTILNTRTELQSLKTKLCLIASASATSPLLEPNHSTNNPDEASSHNELHNLSRRIRCLEEQGLFKPAEVSDWQYPDLTPHSPSTMIERCSGKAGSSKQKYESPRADCEVQSGSSSRPGASRQNYGTDEPEAKDKGKGKEKEREEEEYVTDDGDRGEDGNEAFQTSFEAQSEEQRGGRSEVEESLDDGEGQGRGLRPEYTVSPFGSSSVPRRRAQAVRMRVPNQGWHTYYTYPMPGGYFGLNFPFGQF